MKPGDIVRLAPNMFNDPKIRSHKMLIIDTYRSDTTSPMAVCLVDGVARHFHMAELDILVRS